MSETFEIIVAVVGIVLFAYLIASCSWADKPKPKNDDEPPWDVQI